VVLIALVLAITLIARWAEGRWTRTEAVVIQ